MKYNVRNVATAVCYVGGWVGVSLWIADDKLDLRKWKVTNHYVSSEHLQDPIHLSLRCRTRPPPISCSDYAAGRVLLQVALDGVVPLQGAGVLEIGSGVGTTAIGLAMAARQAGGDNPTRVIATDICPEGIANLTANAKRHGFDQEDGSTNLRICRWDGSCGNAAVQELLRAQHQHLGPPVHITHVIGADLVYHGGADAAGGLANTLASLLALDPSIKVTLLLVNRFSGGAVAAMYNMTGVNAMTASSTMDPALVAFQEHCQAHGLYAEVTELPHELVEQVTASQSLMTQGWWWLCGRWEGLTLVKISDRKRSI